MAVVLDAGALIGYERGDRAIRALLETAQRERAPVRTSTGVVAQAWRNGARQVHLVRLLRGVDQRSLDQPAARRVGQLLGAAATVDVIDAAVIDVATNGDEVLTSDPQDLAVLANAAGKGLTIIKVG
ncbi:MAG TPA: hypothetical protein VE623_19810 [Acidimicrobiales bacterium]|jgi:hypothetical protein|nr:hypothetical protein [Acidimicrobiales bacterium]